MFEKKIQYVTGTSSVCHGCPVYYYFRTGTSFPQGVRNYQSVVLSGMVMPETQKLSTSWPDTQR